MKKSLGSRLLKVFITLLVVFSLFAIWYKLQYSMDPVIGFEVNSAEQPVQILVATQGSPYKNAILEGVMEGIVRPDRYIKVIDVLDLDEVKASPWNAILILHTWEMGKPPITVMPFLNTLPNNNRLVVHNTAGDGVSSIANIDAISGASVLEEVPSRTEEIVRRINLILANNQSISKNDNR